MDFEPPVLEGEDRRRVVEGLKKCIEAYPELREYVVEKARQEARQEAHKEMVALVAHQFERKLGRSLSDAERQTLDAVCEHEVSEQLLDLVLDGTPDELLAWLAGPRDC